MPEDSNEGASIQPVRIADTSSACSMKAALCASKLAKSNLGQTLQSYAPSMQRLIECGLWRAGSPAPSGPRRSASPPRLDSPCKSRLPSPRAAEQRPTEATSDQNSKRPQSPDLASIFGSRNHSAGSQSARSTMLVSPGQAPGAVRSGAQSMPGSMLQPPKTGAACSTMAVCIMGTRQSGTMATQNAGQFWLAMVPWG